MENDNIIRLNYVNNFGHCRSNVLVNNSINDYVDFVLRNDLHDANVYLCSLKEVYNYDNFMYILESICNYLVKIYSITFFEYRMKHDFSDYVTLNRIRERYENVMSIYNFNFDADKLPNNNGLYKKNRFVKRKIYTNDLKRQEI